jgi:hypothetical protein
VFSLKVRSCQAAQATVLLGSVEGVAVQIAASDDVLLSPVFLKI